MSGRPEFSFLFDFISKHSSLLSIRNRYLDYEYSLSHIDPMTPIWGILSGLCYIIHASDSLAQLKRMSKGREINISRTEKS